MVYVDNASSAYGRMLMSHMISDTSEELLRMADTIGVAHRWLQHAGTPKEHFDICHSKRLLAIKAGAIPITQRELGRRFLKLREERLAPPVGDVGRDAAEETRSPQEGPATAAAQEGGGWR